MAAALSIMLQKGLIPCWIPMKLGTQWGIYITLID